MLANKLTRYVAVWIMSFLLHLAMFFFCTLTTHYTQPLFNSNAMLLHFVFISRLLRLSACMLHTKGIYYINTCSALYIYQILADWGLFECHLLHKKGRNYVIILNTQHPRWCYLTNKIQQHCFCLFFVFLVNLRNIITSLYY